MSRHLYVNHLQDLSPLDLSAHAPTMAMANVAVGATAARSAGGNANGPTWTNPAARRRGACSRADPQLTQARRLAAPPSLPQAAPHRGGPQQPPPTRGPPLARPHRHRPAAARQEPARLPRAPLRRRRVGRAARAGPARVVRRTTWLIVTDF